MVGQLLTGELALLHRHRVSVCVEHLRLHNVLLSEGLSKQKKVKKHLFKKYLLPGERILPTRLLVLHLFAEFSAACADVHHLLVGQHHGHRTPVIHNLCSDNVFLSKSLNETN